MTQPLDLAALRKEAEFCAKTNSILYVFPTRILTLIEEVERLREEVSSQQTRYDQIAPEWYARGEQIERLRDALKVAREAIVDTADYCPTAGAMGEKLRTALATLDAALADGGEG